MTPSKKIACGTRLLVFTLMVSLVVSCASQQSTRPTPPSPPAVETAAPPPPAAEPAPAASPAAPPQVALETAPAPAPPPPKKITGKRVIGEVEPVTVLKAGLTLPARIDTGATTSSLDARDIQRFERDGKKWVRFTLVDRRSKKEVMVEGRLTRTVEITRHGADPQIRPVVKLRVALGKVEMLREFSLTDRSSFTYPVLIGRNVLEGKFIVDVALKNTTAPMSEKAK